MPAPQERGEPTLRTGRSATERPGTDKYFLEYRRQGQEHYSMHTEERRPHTQERMRRRQELLEIWDCWIERRIPKAF